MLKKTLKLTIGLFIISNSTFAQWGGSNDVNGDIYRNGNVAIGKTTANHALDVQGNINTNSSVIIDGGDLVLKRTSNPYGFVVRPNVAGYKNLGFAVEGGGDLDLFHVNSFSSVFTGNVYTNASMIIDGGDLVLKRTSNPYGFVLRPNVAGYKKLGFAVEGGGDLDLFHVNSVSSIFTGNVGIGANPGSFKLAVEGKIAARGVKVTNISFADYVFDSTYQLRPLFSVEKFINQYKHLPGIPSAKEVEKEGGFEVGEMNVKLLEKIEELTLYVIELKKENEQMKKAIKEIREKK
jgi:hypothetical protein